MALLVAALSAVPAGAAFAQDFPDLPGMGDPSQPSPDDIAGSGHIVPTRRASHTKLPKAGQDFVLMWLATFGLLTTGPVLFVVRRRLRAPSPA